MKKLCMLALVAGIALLWASSASAVHTAGQVLTKVYSSFATACTQDADADTGEHNRVAMAAGWWLVYCHDGSGSGSACECIQGTSTIDASSVVGTTLFAGEKMIVYQKPGFTHISCVPYADNQYIDVCPLD